MNALQTNGHSHDNDYMAEQTKKVAMDIFHGSIGEVHTEASNENAGNTDAITTKQTIAEVPKPKDSVYELCNTRREKLLPFLNNRVCHKLCVSCIF